MLQEALEKIRAAEEQAAAIVADAERMAATLREETARSVKLQEEESKKRIVEKRRSLVLQAEERGKTRAGELLEETRKQIGTMTEQAELQMPLAVAEIRRRMSS